MLEGPLSLGDLVHTNNSSLGMFQMFKLKITQFNHVPAIDRKINRSQTIRYNTIRTIAVL